MISNPKPSWPAKLDLFGTMVSATTYSEACATILSAARRRAHAAVDHMPVHGLITAVHDRSFRDALNSFEIVAPDGQPIRWALNLLHKARLPDRVYGPDLMLLLFERAAREEVSIYLYGSTPRVIQRLTRSLQHRFPDLLIAGAESPPFRELSQEESEQMIERINDSDAGIVFVGLGCPRQELFAARYREKIDGVLMCVGAAFDFLAGSKKQAPRWMQRSGLEWLFRLSSEPGRLWKRYLVTNSLFVFYIVAALIRKGLCRIR